MTRNPRKSSGVSIRTVPLENGKFVIDVPVSSNAVKKEMFDGTNDDVKEFTHLRYTAVTADPDKFAAEGYTVRAASLGRKTKIAVVMTMYNEDDVLFCRSFRAVMKNIAFLCTPRALWKRDSWKEIVVVIVADGRSKINPRVLTVLGVHGVYLSGLERSLINKKEVQAHMYEFTTQLSIDRGLKKRDFDDSKEGVVITPCQTVFLMKEKNKKKINSHRWFFNAICKAKVCILIDVGTKPTTESFFHLYNSFHYNPLVGGACGEIAADLGPMWKNLLNPLVAVQNFEYKMSNILDKPLESMFGYISVLPGAFSAYRFKALLGAPLNAYFRGENPHGNNVSEANMYLAEDRILCFELVVKSEKSWLLKYVKSARAETDVPDKLDELIAQRRRWLNGSFFAALYASINVMRIFKSRHTTFRKYILVGEFIYNIVNLYFTWFNIGNFYLSFYFIFDASNDSTCTNSNVAGVDPFYPRGRLVFSVFRNLYFISLITIFIVSLGNRPQASKTIYLTISVAFAVMMFLMLFMAFWTISVAVSKYRASIASGNSSNLYDYLNHTPTFQAIFISLMTSYGLYFVSSIIHLDPWHCITCIAQYLLILPTFVNVFMVYAFCNIHDVSWGTKGDNTSNTAGVVKTELDSKGNEVAIVELPAEQADTDAMWNEFEKQLALNALTLNERKEVVVVNADTEHDDFFKEFRTKVVAFWIMSNSILVFIFTNKNVVASTNPGSSSGTYLQFLFWSVTALSCIRGLFSTIYMIQWWNEFLRDSGRRSVLRKVNPES
ncbi:chitin synthase-domain-containing protein [Zopfochytrium polystomum]|nr:chitin synthase-domain-containing protein [Zopfochytrium polystomum]